MSSTKTPWGHGMTQTNNKFWLADAINNLVIYFRQIRFNFLSSFREIKNRESTKNESNHQKPSFSPIQWYCQGFHDNNYHFISHETNITPSTGIFNVPIMVDNKRAHLFVILPKHGPISIIFISFWNALDFTNIFLRRVRLYHAPSWST